MTRGTPDAYVGTSEDGTPDFDVDGSDLATQDEVDALAASKLDKAANLSDLASAPTARDNLGLGDAAIQDAADLPVSTAQAAAIDAINSRAITSTKAGLPVAGIAGRFRQVTDDVRGRWYDTGTQWVKQFPEVNVKDFGAKGDATTDDTTAIQAALNAAAAASVASNVNHVVYFPIGRYNFTALTWPQCNIRTDGPWCTQLRYIGTAGGTAITRTTSNNLFFKGFWLIQGTAVPGTWVDCTADPATDYGDVFEDTFFDTCSGPAVKTGLLTNLHMHRVRWSACEYAIEVMGGGGPLRVLDVNQFTIDFSPAATHKGFIKYVASGNTVTMFARLANGRYEGGSAMVAPAAVVHVLSSPANQLNTQPVKLELENVAFQIGGTQTETIAVMHIETTQVNVETSVVSINTHFHGFSAWQTGAVATGYTVPTFPGLGRVAFAVIGRVSGGTTPAIHAQLQGMLVADPIFDGFLDIEDLGSTPLAPAAGRVRVYGRSGGLRWKNSAAAEYLIAGTNQAQTWSLKQTFSGEIEVDGALNHDGSTVGFYNVTPVARPATYTQTYATATRTHAARTAQALTDNSGGTAADTIPDVPAAYDEATVANIIASLVDEINKLRSDQINTAQVLNQALDDLQANGLLQ